MCMFSRPVKHVSGTRIFARGLDGQQALAYAMNVEVHEDAAMVLPLPVPPRSAEDAVEFVDLQEHRDFFEGLEAAFPPSEVKAMSRGGGFSAHHSQRLNVYDVGDFQASFVPSVGDFDRLEPRFRLPGEVWSKLPEYADWGFAVFKLKTKRTFFRRIVKQSMQPMALRFPRRDPGALFFPTMHVHDGSLPEKAAFDHTFFAQVDDVSARVSGYERSSTLRTTMSEKLGDFVDRDGRAIRWRAGGLLGNQDTWLRPVELKAPELLDQRGRLHRLALSLEYSMRDGRDVLSRRWAVGARTYKDHLPQGLARELAPLLDEHVVDWRLTALDDTLPKGFVSNGSVFLRMLEHKGGFEPVRPTGPFRVELSVGTDRVERQLIELAFAEPPDESRYALIEATLRELIDRVAFA